MRNFNRDRKSGRRDSGRDRSGGRSGGFGGRGGFRDREDSGSFGRGERRPLEMHDAICDKCGKECQVPFKPSGEKPVYCSDCFRKGENSNSESRDSNSYKKEFDIINEKLDRILEALK